MLFTIISALSWTTLYQVLSLYNKPPQILELKTTIYFMILWTDNSCWAQLYGFSGLSWTASCDCSWLPVKQYEVNSRIHEAKTYNSFPLAVGLQTGQIGSIKNDWSLYHRWDSSKRKDVQEKFSELPQAFLEHFSLHPQFFIPRFFIAFYGRFFSGFLYAGLCDFSSLHLFPLHLQWFY